MIHIYDTTKKVLNKQVLYSFISAALKGISQIMLIENVISGIIFLLAITTYSYYLGIIALLSSLIGTLIAKLGGADEKDINQGLFGYNSVLTGIALGLFLNGPNQWIFALVGAAISAVFTAGFIYWFGKRGIPVLTIPFIIPTWILLLSSYRLHALKLNDVLTPQNLADWQFTVNAVTNWIDGSLNGIGQVFFLNTLLTSSIILIGIFFASRKIGVLSLIGHAISFLLSYWLGGEQSLIFSGFYGYNAILTIVAVSTIINFDNQRYALWTGIVASALTVPITAGISTFFLPYGLPALSLPFILCTFLFIGMRKIFPNF